MGPTGGTPTRRGFLNGVPAAGAAAVLGATGASALAAGAAGGARRAVGGSPNPAYSRAVVVGQLVFVAGVVGTKPGGGAVPTEFEAQCRQALDNLKASVEAAGSRLAWVLKCTCFLTNAANFPAFNKMFTEYFPSDPPARSTVVVKELVVSGGTIEIDCVACLES